MIHVTQGHEKGIGLEVFFKSLRLLNQVNIDKLILYADKHYINETLKTITNEFTTEKNKVLFEGKTIRCSFIEDSSYSSTKALESALKVINENDILFTLPTSKDQLLISGKKQLGYTEYLRSYFHNKSLAMVFKNKQHISALLSDHIPLNKVSETLKFNYIREKSEIILENCESLLGPIDDVYFAGINPHAGRPIRP
jgi:4-hydroxythreonine-4-phosphate dehydrogenase